jgi:hypothetical protein
MRELTFTNKSSQPANATFLVENEANPPTRIKANSQQANALNPQRAKKANHQPQKQLTIL